MWHRLVSVLLALIYSVLNFFVYLQLTACTSFTLDSSSERGTQRHSQFLQRLELFFGSPSSLPIPSPVVG